MIQKIILLTILIVLSQQQLTSLPIPADLVLKLSLSMSKLQTELQYFGTYKQNKYNIYKRVKLTKKYLGDLNNQLYKYNNVIVGSGNAAVGNKNIIIGNYNNVTGSNNWVFISNYTGKLNGDLLLGLWIVEIDKDNLILINPRLAISFIDQSKNKPKREKMTHRDHNFCSWRKKRKTTSQSGGNTYNQWGSNTNNQWGSNTNSNSNQWQWGNSYSSGGAYNKNLSGWRGKWGW